MLLRPDADRREDTEEVMDTEAEEGDMMEVEAAEEDMEEDMVEAEAVEGGMTDAVVEEGEGGRSHRLGRRLLKALFRLRRE